MPTCSAPTDAARTDHIVVVGAGLGGVRTVEGLRRGGHTGPITLIGAETEQPYDRPPLSKQVLRGERELVALRDAGYADLDLDLRLGTAVTGLDSAAKMISLDGALGDDTVCYDTLVIATGAGPRVLPGFADHPGVRYLRTATDSLGLRAALATGEHLAVVGGGFIGCEVAASARALGKTVTLVEMLPRPLVGVLGDQVAALVQQLHEDHGVDVRTGVKVDQIEPAQTTQGIDTISGLTLDDGSRVDAHIVLAGLGVTPSVAWLDGSGVHVDDGVVCDEFCRTSAPGVWAVGDVARWTHLGTGDRRRIEHWTNASEMAAAVAANILAAEGAPEASAPRAFTPIPYVWSDQYEFKIQSVGFFAANDDVTVLRVGAKERVFALYSRHAKLTGAVGFSAAPQVMKVRGLLIEGASVQDAIVAVGS